MKTLKKIAHNILRWCGLKDAPHTEQLEFPFDPPSQNGEAPR